MTRTVKAGDTLAKIAQTLGITLARLLDANPQFRANPNKIRVGDVLNVPNGDTSPTVTPPSNPTPTPLPRSPASDRTLGKLSEKFEVGTRGPGTVSRGIGDPGGRSYGSFQMTSKPRRGTVGVYVTQTDFPFRERFRALAPGTDAFTAVWQEIARTQPEEFQASQHAFIKKTHFDVLVEKIRGEDRLDVNERSHTLQDVIWSTAVQHGPNNSIAHRALRTLSLTPADSDFDRRFIIAVYAERGRKRADGVLVNFARASLDQQRGVANRFVQEQRDALRMLADELAR
jgi:murein DD-endopeptidase MepM/ murein hydrolase activator NlpD